MEEKDALYYSDFIYHIEKLAGLTTLEDKEANERIIKREKDIEHNDENGGVYYTPSDFAIKLYNFTLTILKMDEFVQKGPKALRNYPELVKERLNSIFIRIADDYSATPGARYISDGDFSGEDFRDNLLEPKYIECLAKNKKLVIIFDGGYGYPVTFLEETFGGLVRKGYSAEDLLNNMVFISNEEPKLIEDITTFILEEGQRLTRERKQ